MNCTVAGSAAGCPGLDTALHSMLLTKTVPASAAPHGAPLTGMFQMPCVGAFRPRHSHAKRRSLIAYIQTYTSFLNHNKFRAPLLWVCVTQVQEQRLFLQRLFLAPQGTTQATAYMMFSLRHAHMVRSHRRKRGRHMLLPRLKCCQRRSA